MVVAKVASNSTVLVKVLPRVNVPRAAALVMAKSVATAVGGAVTHAAPLTVTV
jgi:hypothetical protein